MEPSASLLTAVLVAGATFMSGLAERNGQPLRPYDVNQGFGRVDLSKSLPLSDVTPENWRLQVRAVLTKLFHFIRAKYRNCKHMLET